MRSVQREFTSAGVATPLRLPRPLLRTGCLRRENAGRKFFSAVDRRRIENPSRVYGAATRRKSGGAGMTTVVLVVPSPAEGTALMSV